ncbi:MAG: lipopolysaccharide assembly protein LapB [Pseudomonadota bacterium]
MSFDFDFRDLLWLLLPVAAASGWLAARLDLRRHGRQKLDLPAAYFQGLNYLLNEQPDKAIEVFLRVLEVNSETVETHLALGSLFRRRGEVERAIRVHQNLIARPTLDKDQRSKALLELGHDYFKAGLLDRAENLFLELTELRAHSEPALRQLLHIYQQERDWEKAIAVARKLARVSDKNMDAVIAQYWCELAEAAASRGNLGLAREALRDALKADRNCVRASILSGDLALKENDPRQAIQRWRHIEEQDPRYLGEVAQRIADAYRQLDDGEGLHDYFRRVHAHGGEHAVALILAGIIRARDGRKAAEHFVIDWLRRRPNVHGLHELISLNLEEVQGQTHQDLMLLKGIIESLREQHQGYVCEQCGFKARKLHWLCPGCNRWNTVRALEDNP